MQFDITENGALRVLLSDRALRQIGISFADLDSGSPLTQAAIKTVLLSAEAQTGFDLSNPLLVEAVPVEGGCLLLCTPDRAGAPRFSRRMVMPPTVWRFRDVDALLAFSCAIAPMAPRIRRHAAFCASSLFRQGEQYVLILYAPSLLPRSLMPILTEFAVRIGGEKAAAWVAEHTEPICRQDALCRLTAPVSSAPDPTDQPH